MHTKYAVEYRRKQKPHAFATGEKRFSSKIQTVYSLFVTRERWNVSNWFYKPRLKTNAQSNENTQLWDAGNNVNSECSYLRARLNLS